MQKRLVVLVPSAADEMHSEYREKYWPNFVHRVREALEREKLDCDVRVIDPAVRGEQA